MTSPPAVTLTSASVAEQAPQPDQPIWVATVVAPHGVEGWLKLKTCDAHPDWLRQPMPPLWLKRPKASHWQLLTAVVAHQAKAGIVRLQWQGCTTRNQAEALVGCQVAIEANHLPPPADPDTYRAYQLEGLTVLAADTGEPLGKVTTLVFGAGNEQAFLELALLPYGVTRLVPFNSTFVPTVDLVTGSLTVQGLEDFLRQEAQVQPTTTAKASKPLAKCRSKRSKPTQPNT